MSMSKMVEALLAARDAAVEARAREYGPMYSSALEGYGDLTRELLYLQESVKVLKKEMAVMVEWVNAQDTQGLAKTLVMMDGKAQRAAFDAVRICAAVQAMQETIRSRTGGDLLDLMQGSDDEEEEDHE